MRIIAGEFRGRRLLPPQGQATRPITDRAKQSLFDMLAPRLAGAVVYDCFAGTGSQGLEALSRGADHVTFFEADRSAAARLRKNIETLGVAGRCRIVSVDLFKWFSARQHDPQQRVVDLVFLDPPYRFRTDRPEDLRRLGRQLAEQHLAADGLVVFRHDAKDMLELPGLIVQQRREYGGMGIDLLVRE